MYRSIIVPVDIAQPSSWRFALPQALALAEPGGARVALVTVVRELKAMFEGVYFPFQLEQLAGDAERKLAAIAAEAGGAAPGTGAGTGAGGVEIAREVRFGSIGHEVLACAAERRADLIVMESHRPEMLDYLIGPNAAHVAQNAPCSVFVLRSHGG
ncbi:Nucleotide-binding universal stress protein, UspA family [Tistlia consotensis]|uniref:Nucleotide-binding universal stress protein, UspA family n=1 Tax=Tistlia consotensis USBA 355 TaxID=560819 RepID=A0A1Y6BFB0_9PROT|nr:universal stress protein [Tistlia consotensis]SMF07970.1 Nucleotide-binding universal stress protein, UspA family [Tistlia consotensis USBA 355]SNR35605.1 Nucleotide-binding universal stress protein, UspA family [Tistlia consotensis]